MSEQNRPGEFASGPGPRSAARLAGAGSRLRLGTGARGLRSRLPAPPGRTALRHQGLLLAAAVLILTATAVDPAMAQTAPAGPAIPPVNLQIGDSSVSTDTSLPLQILALLTLLAVAPAVLMMMTSFTRIVIVLGLTRNALGAQQIPPNQVLMGLALCLTLFTMQPTLSEMHQRAVGPYLAKQMTFQQAVSEATPPLRGFMLRQTRENDLALFVELSRIPQPKTARDVPTHVLIPAFIISELKTAFIMGFVIFLPFLVIDLVVSTVLTSMGMMMLPPTLVSLPFKLLLFVMVDGWHLLVRALTLSFR